MAKSLSLNVFLIRDVRIKSEYICNIWVSNGTYFHSFHHFHHSYDTFEIILLIATMVWNICTWNSHSLPTDYQFYCNGNKMFPFFDFESARLIGSLLSKCKTCDVYLFVEVSRWSSCFRVITFFLWPLSIRLIYDDLKLWIWIIGFPIVDDELYNTDVWGPQRGKNAEYGKSYEEVWCYLKVTSILLIYLP